MDDFRPCFSAVPSGRRFGVAGQGLRRLACVDRWAGSGVLRQGLRRDFPRRPRSLHAEQAHRVAAPMIGACCWLAGGRRASGWARIRHAPARRTNSRAAGRPGASAAVTARGRWCCQEPAGGRGWNIDIDELPSRLYWPVGRHGLGAAVGWPRRAPPGWNRRGPAECCHSRFDYNRHRVAKPLRLISRGVPSRGETPEGPSISLLLSRLGYTARSSISAKPCSTCEPSLGSRRPRRPSRAQHRAHHGYIALCALHLGLRALFARREIGGSRAIGSIVARRLPGPCWDRCDRICPETEGAFTSVAGASVWQPYR